MARSSESPPTRTIRSRYSDSKESTKRSANAFMFGAWTDVRTIVVPLLFKIVPNCSENSASRSTIKYRFPVSDQPIASSRAAGEPAPCLCAVLQPSQNFTRRRDRLEMSPSNDPGVRFRTAQVPLVKNHLLSCHFVGPGPSACEFYEGRIPRISSESPALPR